MRKCFYGDIIFKMFYRAESNIYLFCAYIDQSDQEKRVHDLSQKSVNCEEKIPDQDKTDKSEVNIQYLDSVIVTEDGLCRLHHMLAASASIASKYLI